MTSPFTYLSLAVILYVIMYLILVVIIVLVVVGLYHYYQKSVLEGYGDRPSYNQPFSLITNDISDGNAVSMSHRPNPYLDINDRGRPDPVVYQSHGIPLLHEDHPTAPADTKMFHFQNYSCRPECCTYSPFGCSNGCVCWEAPPQTGIEQNSDISPRS